MSLPRLHSFFQTLRTTKLRSCGLDALRLLGPGQFLRMWFYILGNLPTLWSKGRELAMRNVAFAMGRGRPLRIRYRGETFRWDCGFNDRRILDAPSFYLVQEMLIRDSYFVFHPDSAFSKARTVVDSGANRGLFSLVMATHAEKVVAVECLDEFAQVFEHNMKLNGFTNYALERCFIGTPPPEAGPGARSMSMNELFNKHGLETVDFLKMDIEGGEFALFRESGWLSRVRHLTMEVHFDCGTLREVYDRLVEAGFTCRITSWDLHPIADPNFHGPPNCCLVFASRPTGP